jgi:hypothetical protein
MLLSGSGRAAAGRGRRAQFAVASGGGGAATATAAVRGRVLLAPRAVGRQRESLLARREWAAALRGVVRVGRHHHAVRSRRRWERLRPRAGSRRVHAKRCTPAPGPATLFLRRAPFPARGALVGTPRHFAWTTHVRFCVRVPVPASPWRSNRCGVLCRCQSAAAGTQQPPRCLRPPATALSVVPLRARAGREGKRAERAARHNRTAKAGHRATQEVPVHVYSSYGW